MDEPPQADPPQIGEAAIPTWFLTIVTISMLLGLVWFARDFLIPLALATLLLILNMAIIDRLDSVTICRKSAPRWLAYTVATAFMFLVVIGLGYSLSNQAAAFTEAAPRYAARLASLRAEIEALLGTENVAAAETAIQDGHVESWIAGFAVSAGRALGTIGLVLLYLAFMLADRGLFAQKLPKLCKTSEEAKQLADILKLISIGVRQYMWINTVTSAMSGTLAFIVLSFLGVDFALTLASIVFLLNFIPSIGSFLATLLPALVALLQFDTLIPALIVVVVYGGGDAIIGNIVQPKLQGKSLNLSTFMVMVALTFWGMMWGGVGAFMAVPLTVVIMIVCSGIPSLHAYARLLSSDGVLPGESAD